MVLYLVLSSVRSSVRDLGSGSWFWILVLECCPIVFNFCIFVVVTPVVTGRRVTPTANEGIGAGAKVAIFRSFCDSYDVPRLRTC